MTVMKIKEARKMNGNMKQKELAAKTGFSERSIIRWEKGETEPNREAIEQLASALNVSTDYLMGREEQKNAPSPQGERVQRRIDTNLIEIPVISREWTACCGGGVTALDLTSEDGRVVSIPRASLRAYDASVEDKGIVVVSRSSEAAQATGAVSSEELASKRTVAVAQANAASPHTKGVHPDGPDATREAGA